jgi:hypothetical protein
MRTNTTVAVLAALFFSAAGLPATIASAQEGANARDTATVVGLYVEQAPGVLADVKLLRNRSGRLWAEIRRDGDKAPTELVRVPAGVALNSGDRILVASRGTPSASVGASTPTRVPVDPHLERPLDLTGLLSHPQTRPLAVVPGSCVPF